MYKEEAFTSRKGFGVAGYPFNDPRSRNIDYTKFNCTTAHWLTDRTISFWTHPTFEEKHIQADIDAFNKVAEAYMK
jgi:hypothetical protein